MTPQPKDPAKMTKAELVEAVAVEVMGWEKRLSSYVECRYCKVRDQKSYQWWSQDMEPILYPVWCGKWNPLTDWNHWREVEEKIMEDDKRLRIFLDVLEPKDGEEDEWGGWHAALMAYLKADLRTRCVAAILAVRSASPNPL